MDKVSVGPGIFTPDGRLGQVEFAMEAVENSNNLIAIKTQNGFIIGTEIKNETEIEDERKYPRNIFLVDKHITIGVSGNIPDSQIVINHARTQSQQYRFVYQDDIPVNEIIVEISNIIQQFTQTRTSRPIGCSLIIGGWDRFSGFQLIRMDPSGTFSSWNAISIGSNCITNQIILNNEYKKGLSTNDALATLIRVIKKKVSSTVPSRIFDVHTCHIDDEKNILIHRLSKKELDSLINR
jgi:20S proteasome subunit alpha 3